MTSPSDNAIVIRSRVEVIPTGDVYHDYWLLTSPLNRKALTRQQAEDYIMEHGLVLALDCKHGQVWDTPEKVFQKTYTGFVGNHYAAIKQVWD